MGVAMSPRLGRADPYGHPYGRCRWLEIWQPAAKAIMLKQAQLHQRAGHCDRFKMLCQRTKVLTDLSKVEALDEEINDAEDAIDKHCDPIAFADRAKDTEELFRYQMAADYADRWPEVKCGSGRVL